MKRIACLLVAIAAVAGYTPTSALSPFTFITPGGPE
jgi:hypothetical protein